VWKHISLPDPTPLQYNIAEYLQDSNHKRKVIEAFRGCGKSFITSAFVCHKLLLNPNEKILVVSASKQRSDDFSIFTKRLLSEVPCLQHLAPNDKGRNSNIAFDVAGIQPAHAPSVKSVGITGQLTGSRATLIIADDVESANNSATQVQREKLSESIKEFEAIITPDPGSEIIFLGTPQTEESIYNLLNDRGYTTRIWTARYPKDQKALNSYGSKLAKFIKDKWTQDLAWLPVDPKRFDDLDLSEREASYGRSGFALQFQLDTTLSDADKYPLKLADLIVMDIDKEKAPVKISWGTRKEERIEDLPNVGFTGDRFHKPFFVSDQWDEYSGTVMSIDPSGRGKDKTGYAIVKQLNGMLFVVDAGGLMGGYSPEALETLAKKAREHQVNEIVIESNFGDGMFSTLLKPVLSRIYPVTINPDEVRHNTQKELRIIDSLEVIMNQHRLIVDKGLILKDARIEDKNHQLFYQMTRMTRQKGALLHDDAIDALAIACKYWTVALERDSNQALSDYKEEALRKELDKFMESAGQLENYKDDLWVSV
jgi:Holliday junction resolvasome RuvABC endonuclease subunit